MNAQTEVAVRSFDASERESIKAQMSTEVIGPTALSVNWRRFVTLTWLLAYFDFKLKFFGSVLGYLWQLIRPMLMFAVLYVVFTQVIRIGGEVERFPLVLLSGIVVFTFFSEATNGAVPSVVDRESLIRKISFPILAVPVAAVTSVYLNFLLNYGVVIIFMLASGVTPTLLWLEIIPLVALLYLFTVSVAMVVSAYYVKFRDVAPIWEVFCSALFYAIPIIYSIEYVQARSEIAAKIMMCNPVAAIIEQLRHAVIDPDAPGAAAVLGSQIYLLIPAGIMVLFFVLGYLSFRRMSPSIAEDL